MGLWKGVLRVLLLPGSHLPSLHWPSFSTSIGSPDRQRLKNWMFGMTWIIGETKWRVFSSYLWPWDWRQPSLSHDSSRWPLCRHLHPNGRLCWWLMRSYCCCRHLPQIRFIHHHIFQRKKMSACFRCATQGAEVPDTIKSISHKTFTVFLKVFSPRIFYLGGGD